MNAKLGLAATALTSLLSGCTTVMKASSYLETKEFSSERVVKLVLCRPSGLIAVARRPDVYLDGEIVADIGAGEQVEVQMKSTAQHTLSIFSRAYSTSFNPGKDLRLNTKFRGGETTAYVLSVEFGGLGTLPAPGLGDTSVSFNWRLQKVDPKSQLIGCKVDNVRKFIPK